MTKKSKPKKLATIAKRKLDVCVVCGDLHDPYCDEAVLGMVCTALEIIKPTVFVENGDGFDFYPLSPFSKNPKRRLELSEDRLVFVNHRLQISKSLSSKCDKIYLAGTHERWLQRFLYDKVPEFAGLAEFAPERFLQLDIMGWDYRANDEDILPALELGNLLVTHGYVARQESGASAKASFDKEGRSVLVNHTHRLGSYWKTDSRTTHVAYENGHLYDTRKMKYGKGARTVNWQQGFSVVLVDRESGWFRVEQIPIVKVPHTNIKRMFLHEGIVEAVCL